MWPLYFIWEGSWVTFYEILEATLMSCCTTLGVTTLRAHRVQCLLVMELAGILYAQLYIIVEMVVVPVLFKLTMLVVVTSRLL